MSFKLHNIKIKLREGVYAMQSKFITGVTTGAIIGAAIGMMLMPQKESNIKKRIKRSRKMMKHAAGDIYDTMTKWSR
jgi:gas vesicle protein